MAKSYTGLLMRSVVHPFLDGNGRIGRLLITLYLVEKKLLHKPALYLADFFERNRGSYYDALTVVRQSNNLLHWVTFFLTAVVETATSSRETFMNIMALRQDVEHQILNLGKRAEKAKTLLMQLYQHPIMTVNQAAEILKVSHQAANGLVQKLVEMKILEESTGFARNRQYVFYMGIRADTLSPAGRDRESIAKLGLRSSGTTLTARKGGCKIALWISNARRKRKCRSFPSADSADAAPGASSQGV